MSTYIERPSLLGYTYSREEAMKTRDRNGLLSIRLETSLLCNLRCKYCCNKSGVPLNNEISYDKILDLINQAQNLGAKSIVVIGGGEPTLYPYFKQLIHYIADRNLIPVIFTNTTTMTKELASFLYETNTTVITKLDSLNEEIQDDLSGVEGTFQKIQLGLSNLLDAGFSQTNSEGKLRLGVSFVVSKINSNEVLDIWKYCRTNNIYPNLEMMIPNGEAQKFSSETFLRPEEWKQLKLELLNFDRKNYNINWEPQYPLCNGCLQTYYNLYINVLGNVRPCSSIHMDEIGINLNVNNMTLEEILDSPYFKHIRNIDKKISGKCKICRYSPECIGCRAMAFTNGIHNGKEFYSAFSSEDNSCSFFCV